MIERQFRDRMNAVSFYLRSLRELENAHRTPGRGFYRASVTLAASRAAAFIMIYNGVEFATRESVLSLRRHMEASGATFGEVRDFWKDDIVWVHFKDKLENGINHETLLTNFRSFVPGRVNWLTQANRVPFPGNIDHEKLIRFTRSIGVQRWRPPRGTLGGSDLALIKKARNELAHGEDTFESIGSTYSISDIADKLARVRSFMCSFIQAMERYRARDAFKI